LIVLERLSLGSNLFSGTLPTELGSLVKLQVDEFGNNKFGGTLPQELTISKI